MVTPWRTPSRRVGSAELGERSVGVLRQPPQHVEGTQRVDTVALHDDALGLADDIPAGESGGRVVPEHGAAVIAVAACAARASTRASSSASNASATREWRFKVPTSSRWVYKRTERQLRPPASTAADAYAGHRVSVRKSAHRTMGSDLAASRHGPSPSWICIASSCAARGEVGGGGSKLFPIDREENADTVGRTDQFCRRRSDPIQRAVEILGNEELTRQHSDPSADLRRGRKTGPERLRPVPHPSILDSLPRCSAGTGNAP